VLIGTLVFRSMRVKVDLVSKDYYKEELAYQQVIDSKNNAQALSSPVKINRVEEGVLIELPYEMHGRSVTGNLWFYCPSNSLKDKKLPLQVDEEGRQLVPLSFTSGGNYILKMDWATEGRHYFQEARVAIP